jgi:putative PIG3 family NAD(P)H quinone oxidoreductase
MYPPPEGITDIPGLEVAGTIAAAGADVLDFKEGDEVMALVAGGGYADHCIAAQECLLPIPAGMSMTEAAGVPETFFTVWSTVFNRAYLDESETLLVHGGSSGIGTTAIQLAKAFGARVFITAGSDEKCAFCTALGADAAINYNTADFVKEIARLTDGKGVDVILDMVAGDYVPRNIASLAENGRMVMIAFMGGTSAEINLIPFLLKRISLTGAGLRARSNIFKGAIAEDLKAFVWPMFEDGRIKSIIDSTFPLAEAAEAHKRMESSAHMGKIILTV